MKTFNDNMTLQSFEAWSGAVDTKKTILDNNKADEFNSLIEELYPDGLSETALNDLLWFEEDFLFKSLSIVVED